MEGVQVDVDARPRNGDVNKRSIAVRVTRRTDKVANGIADGGAEDAVDGQGHGHGPPPKRRKLSIRMGRQQQQQQPQQQHTHTHTQTTLDHFYSATPPPPPSRVTVLEPHGPLVSTLNGVRTTVDVREDDLLLRPSPKPTSSRRTTRSPQPAAPATKPEDRRSLRSQDEGPRLKSDLGYYFPNYEDIIFDAPQEDEFLTVDVTLYVTDDVPKSGTGEGVPPNKSQTLLNGRRTSTSNYFNGSSSLNLDFVANNIPDNPDDPLTDAHFFKSHRRAERKEKQLRNIEKEKAMHEKSQLDRLLEGLQGHDWLKVLGITGITDSEAKKFEPKRDYFIAEVVALVAKFKQWKEQEKKQRLEKEAAAAREAEEEEVGETTEGSSVEPPSSDLNASAAKQLQQETANALKHSTINVSHKGKERANLTSHPATPAAAPRTMLPLPPPSPEVPITSFYSKRHLRDAALGKSRHGRNVTAFGQPLPEMNELEFELPEEYVTEDVLRATAREKRRRKRESVANAS